MMNSKISVNLIFTKIIDLMKVFIIVKITEFYSHLKKIRENSVQCNLVLNVTISRNFCETMHG